MSMPWCQHGTGKARRQLPAPPAGLRSGAVLGVGRCMFLGHRGWDSELASLPPNCTALAPIWTLRGFGIRMTLTCLCLSVTLLHPLRSKEKLSDMC